MQLWYLIGKIKGMPVFIHIERKLKKKIEWLTQQENKFNELQREVLSNANLAIQRNEKNRRRVNRVN